MYAWFVLKINFPGSGPRPMVDQIISTKFGQVRRPWGTDLPYSSQYYSFKNRRSVNMMHDMGFSLPLHVLKTSTSISPLRRSIRWPANPLSIIGLFLRIYWELISLPFTISEPSKVQRIDSKFCRHLGFCNMIYSPFKVPMGHIFGSS